MKRNTRMTVWLLIVLAALTSCAGKETSDPDEMVTEYFGATKNAFGNVAAPADFDWQQCSGIALDFIVENNINANILARECDKFTAVTGISVNIKNLDFDTMSEKINLEFISKAGQYELIYVDPYQTLTKFHDSLEDLNQYEQDESLPHIVGGMESFNNNQMEVCSYFGEEEQLRSIPFDSTTMILYYRKDIFEKYEDQMNQDLGYTPVPGSSSFTWERYIEVAEWIKVHVPESEIKYPSINMSKQHNSIYTEFCNLLSAYGGDYFSSEQNHILGVATGGEIRSREPAFIKALEMYKQLVDLEPELIGKMDWVESAKLFQEGSVAMMLNWDENAASIENERESPVAGKVGYGILPYGSAQSANIYGGSGIGINRYISDKKKLASWLFIVWASSPEVQIRTFLEVDGGNMPTRSNLNALITGQYLPLLPHAQAAISAQNKSNVYYRPKMENGYEFERIMTANLKALIFEEQTVAETADQIYQDWEDVRSAEARDQE